MVKRYDNKQLLKESLVVTLLIVVITLALQYFPINLDLAQPVKQELNDFDIYDIAYSGEAKNNHARDTNIIIFQIADTREKIAEQIKLLQKYKPAVVGVDITFKQHPNILPEDFLLQEALKSSNIVTANKILGNENGIDEMMPNYFDNGTFDNSGFINFWGDSISVVRYYPPFRTINNKKEFAFTSRIIEKFEHAAFSALKKRNSDLQIINYKGNIESYTSFLNGQFDTAQMGEKITGKIVLLGVLYKKSPLLLYDLHFTPLNETLNGKSFPDMYGAVIHANILSMILSGNYIDLVSKIWSYAIGLILTFLLAYYQLRFYYKKKDPSEILFFLLQFLIVIILVGIFLFIYKMERIKVPLFPIIIPIVLCVEILEAYKLFLEWVSKRSKKRSYKSIFVK